MVIVKWLGVAGLEFTWNGHTYLIDPYLSRNSKTEVFFKKPVSKINVIDTYLDSLQGKLAAIIIGHCHQDHAMDVPELSGRFEGRSDRTRYLLSATRD